MNKEFDNYSSDKLQNEIQKILKEITQEDGLISAINQDTMKFLKGNKTASTRARKNSQNLKKLLQDLRVCIQLLKNKR